MKKCRECKEFKELVEFHKHPSTKDGLNTKCKSCKNTQRMKYHYEGGGQEKRRMLLYGVTKEEVEWLSFKQGYKCAVCKNDDKFLRTKEWHIDHSHNTGAVRGILCKSCNVMLGYAKDNPEILRAGALYLEESNG